MLMVVTGQLLEKVSCAIYAKQPDTGAQTRCVRVKTYDITTVEGVVVVACCAGGVLLDDSMRPNDTYRYVIFLRYA
jgi:hypothetical protein